MFLFLILSVKKITHTPAWAVNLFSSVTKAQGLFLWQSVDIKLSWFYKERKLWCPDRPPPSLGLSCPVNCTDHLTLGWLCLLKVNQVSVLLISVLKGTLCVWMRGAMRKSWHVMTWCWDQMVRLLKQSEYISPAVCADSYYFWHHKQTQSTCLLWKVHWVTSNGGVQECDQMNVISLTPPSPSTTTTVAFLCHNTEDRIESESCQVRSL